MKAKTRIVALIMIFTMLFGLAMPAVAADTASVIKLAKTSGTVTVSKSSGKTLSVRNDMRLYNGYQVVTETESYAWLNLDDTKMLKTDAASEVEVRKSGKQLEVKVWSGSVFFDVSQTLKDDESLNISTSTMIVGIRGTSGYVQTTGSNTAELTVLEGAVECTVSDPVSGQTKTETVSGGETVECVVYPQEQEGDKCEIIREKAATEEVPGYVLTDLVENVDLCDKILEGSGMDILRDLAAAAGGDPSGRSSDGRSASPEVLGKAGQQQTQDEDSFRQKLNSSKEKEKEQPDGVSSDKALPNPTTPVGGGGSGGSGGGGGGGDSRPTAPTAVTETMPVTTSRLQELLNASNSVTVRKNDDLSQNNLTVDSPLSVPSGKTLTLESGVNITVNPEQNLRVDGTLDEQGGSLQNNGTITVASGDTLRVKGDFNNSGTLIVTATGRVVTDGVFSSAGTVSLSAGAQVLARQFDLSHALDGWSVSANPGSDGYRWLYRSYTVTFDYNGVPVDGAPSRATTDENGRMTGLPTPEPTSNTAAFDGWYTAAEGGEAVTEETVFTQDTTIFAHWNISDKGWSYDADTKTLTVTSDAAMKDYNVGVSDDRPWAEYTGEIEAVTIRDGVTKIGARAFNSCVSLADITIPTSVTRIGPLAFHTCTGLESVTIPSSVTEIDESAFCFCTGLTNISIPASVTSIEYNAFGACSALTDITFGGTMVQWNTANPGNRALFPDTTTVRCSDGELKARTVSFSFNYIPPGDEAPRENPSPMSTGPDGKLRGALPNADRSGYAFDGWYTAAAGGDKVDEAYVFTQDMTLYAHWTLTQGWELDEATKSLTVAGTGTMEEIFPTPAIPEPSETPSPQEIVPWNGRRADIKTAVVRSGVTSIMACAFENCTALTDVEIPAGVTDIGSSAFTGCTALTGITFTGTVAEWGAVNKTGADIPGSVPIHCSDGDFIGGNGWSYSEKGKKLTILSDEAMNGYADFRAVPWNSYFNEIETVEIRTGVTKIGGRVFYNCTRLTSVTLDYSYAYEIIGDSAFEGCGQLKDFTVPNVKSIGGGAFAGCTFLEYADVSNATSIGGGAFSGSGLKGIALGEGINCIEDSVFAGCDALTEISIPDSVVTIGDYAFYRCNGLTEISIPDGVTAIGDSAFSECTSLKSVALGEGINSIGAEAFAGCAALTDIRYGGTRVQWNAVTKGTDAIPDTVTVHCSDGDYVSYTVSFDTDGGSAVAAQTVNHGGTAAQPDDPTKNFMVFEGWYADESFATEFDFTAPITGDTAVYAKWRTYQITFDPNNGYFGLSEDPVSVAANSSGKLDSDVIPENPILAGWDFTGWSTSESGGDTSKIDPASFTFSADTILYAQWEDAMLTVRFDLGGAPGSPPADQRLYASEALGSVDDPAWDGHVFLGWSMDGGNTIFNFGSVLSSMTLVAQWGYTVTFDLGSQGDNTTENVRDGGTVNRPADDPTGNKLFDGWYADASFATEFDFDAPITANTTVYAKWVGYRLLEDGTLYVGKTAVESGYSAARPDVSGAPWYSERNSIIHVVLPDNATEIGANAFNYCTNMTAVKIPAGVTGINQTAFNNCTQAITFTYSGTSEQWESLMSGVTACDGWTVRGDGWGGSYDDDGGNWVYDA